jgi:murein DD-endopeptidase MepM/ murein hydrolase activator NlpD
VAYAGEELAGFGKVVVIIHPGGLVTVYAHNSELRTVAGEKVKRGSRIALLGSTGISRGPHVHFEVIFGGQLCDAMPLFRPSPTAASGRPLFKASQQKTWPRSGGPPKGLRCGPRVRHPAYVGRPRGVRIPDDEQREILARLAAAEGEAEPDPDLEQGEDEARGTPLDVAP